MRGFNFNKNARLTNTFLAPFTISIDRAAGIMTVNISLFVPGKMINAPEGATHFRLKAGGAAIDFANHNYFLGTAESADLLLTEDVQGPLQLNIQISPGASHPLFLVFGIAFTQSLNDEQAQLKNAAFNAMAIVSVER